MRHHSYKVIAGLAALLSAGTVGVASAAVSPASAPAWRSVFRAGVSGQVTAVTATRYAGQTAEFAFVSDGAKPAMYSRSGAGSWALTGITGAETGEAIVSATAIGPTEVLAFTQIQRLHGGGRVLKGTGHTVALKGGGTELSYTWSVLGTFDEPIGSASVLAADDIWVFGSRPDYPATGTLGVWHYNGHAWTRVGSGFMNGSAASATSVWAVDGTSVVHFNGKKWTSVNVATLLPAPSTFDAPQLSTIYAEPGGAAYAIGSGNTQDAGGPIVVLQYDGRTWKKVASYPVGDPSAQVSTDGHGGVWIPASGSEGAPANMLHYVNGSHTVAKASLPGLTNSAMSGLLAIANIPGTAQELAGGFVLNTPGNEGTPVARAYQYS